MRRLALAAALLITLTGCASTTGGVHTTVETSTVPAPTDTAVAAASSSDTTTQPAHVGDTIELQGDSGNIDLTLTKVAAVTATDGFSTPPAGDGFYGVQIRIKNLGTAAYSDAVSNDVSVQDAQGQSYKTDIVGSINAGPLFPTLLTIAPGGTSLGWIVLDVPVHTVVTQAQFTLSSGFGSGAQWIIP